MNSLTKNTRLRADSVHALAAELGIGVNVLKRLCNWGIIPSPMLVVDKTPGGHWRVTQADMPSLKASVLIWKWWHRKGLCRRKSPEKQSLTHSHARQDELAALAFDLIQMLGRGFILTTDDCSAWTAELKEAWNETGTDDPVDSDRLLDKVKHLSRERIELLILQVNVGRIRQEKGDGSIGIRELAKRMGIGVATLYRIYGKNVLRKFLNQSATEKFPGSKEQTAQAVVSKRSGQFTYQNNNEKDEKFWDENRATTGGTANQVSQPPEGKRIPTVAQGSRQEPPSVAECRRSEPRHTRREG